MSHPTSPRPRFSQKEALKIARVHFGIPASAAEPLPSDRDQNFLLVEEQGERRWVLKIARAGEDPGVLDFQNKMLAHLARGGFRLSNVLHTTDGREVVPVHDPEGSTFLVRVLTWIPGTQLYRANPHSLALCRSLGAFLGGMDRALEDFSHPAQNRVLDWDLRWVERVVGSSLDQVAEAARRDLLEKMTKRFLQRLSPVASELRLSVIHGDANDHNVLVSEPGPGGDPEGRRVTGIVDFGDAVRSYTVAEAAIAGAYLMLDKGWPFQASAHLVSGYHRALPLREAEISALFPLMGLRICASLAMSARQKRMEPENEYLTVSEAPAWTLLERLEGEVLDLPPLLFREACGLDPVPVSARVVAWLETHGREASPVLGRPTEVESAAPDAAVQPLDLAEAPLHVFDLSHTSTELDRTPPMEDAEAWTALLFSRMEEARAEVGIGRYEETRRLYTSDIFQAPGDDPPEWRTLHMGIDLFVPDGCPVLAPFDALVHSVADNDGYLDYGPTVILEHHVREERSEPLRFWTLYGHLAPGVTTDLYPGQPLTRGESFARVGTYPGNGNWAPHLHFQIITDPLGMEGDFPGVALPSRRRLWKALSPDPNLILGIPDSRSEAEVGRSGPGPGQGLARPGVSSGAPLAPRGGRSEEEILEARRRHLGPTLSVAYKRPLKIVRGSGQFLFDHEGQRYLDCVNNVPHVGHNHPRVVEAGQRQMALLNTNTRYLHDLLVDYAERLAATLPEPLSVVYFVCTGSEANELALRMARAHTGRQDVLVVDGAYHGNTSATVDLSPYKFDRRGGEGARPWVHKTLMPDPYRGRFRATEKGPGSENAPPGGDDPEEAEYLPMDQLGRRYAQDVREILHDLESRGGGVAAFFCEPLLGCGGQIVPPPGYMAAAFQHVRNAGGVCVADEVQVGFGRVGTHFWAFESQGVVPDIVTLGKPMANGHPVGAVVTTPDIAASFDTGMEYFNTFGGNPVSCAIGLAVMDVIQEEGLQENARVVGGYLLHQLRRLAELHPVVGDVRGLGLYLGVEMVEDRATREPSSERAARTKERLRDHRILLSTDGPSDNVLKIKPPLVFTRNDADRLISVLDRVFREDGIRLG